MLNNLKAMAVVLFISMAVFAIAKPICLRFMEETDFARRRNVWFVLTLTAFLSTSFWIYVLVAMPLLAWSARKDTNPVALYVLVLNVIPPLEMPIPVVGINQLFDFSNARMLAFAILIPVAWKICRSTDKKGFGGLALMDVLILAYCGLLLVLLMPYESITNTMRRGFLFFIDFLVLYFVVSRICTSRNAIVETMASACLACAVLAPLGLFEALWGWLLYGEIAGTWDLPMDFAYLFRGGTLRAQVSTGHALVLGNMMAIGFGFWLYIRSRVSMFLTISVAAWIWIGLLAAYSRGPWIVACVLFFVCLALGPNGPVRVLKATLISTVLAGLVLASPIGERVIDNLPFVGKVDEANITYRQQLVEMSWQLIQQNPFFGSPFVLTYMESLRQGQGIIDLVNTYARIALFYGLVGLCLYLGFFFIAMQNVRRLVKHSAVSDPDLSSLGISLIACIVGILLMMAFGGYGQGVEKMSFVIAGLAAGYAQLGQIKVTDRTGGFANRSQTTQEAETK